MKKSESSIPSSSKVKFDDSDDSEYSSEDEGGLETELADVTFEELQKARSNGTHSVFQKSTQEKKAGRANKNRPMEASSKKPVSRFREVITVPKKVVRDPRFETLCGKLDDGFRKRYDFLFEKELPGEKEELQKKLKKTNDPTMIEELRKNISWIDKLVTSSSAKRTDADILAEHKKKEREAAKRGKRPFYLKKSEIRKQKLVEQYDLLKASGKVESFIAKKRRKNASKDLRYKPYQRRENKMNASKDLRYKSYQWPENKQRG
ncbi:uncharacterized protein LOC131164360 isoform X2 [Malania oleifera]|uniref:uncharacterized protein LOC131164360 isoform X2 n=1 Tax=Malania oleifera TaxID=397392 RepID=UPI0025AE49E7|nr:uncharacterized protein LOC131164360 isoform X2 [Malania oleifera]